MHEVMGRTHCVSVLYNAVPSLTLDRQKVQIGHIAFKGVWGFVKELAILSKHLL